MVPGLFLAAGILLIAAFRPSWRVEPPERWLRLNIPGYRLDVLDDSTVVRSYRVAVGMRAYATPVGSFAIDEITWNPVWVPPRAEWAKNDTVTPPGPDNPVGKVKLRFDGLIFVHGTPLVSTLGRAVSHACVRLRNADAIALARELQRRDSAVISDATVDSLLVSWDDTRRVSLRTPVRFEIVYELAVRRDSVLVLYPDVYRRGKAGYVALALRAMAAAGDDTTRVSRTVLAAAARRVRTRPVTVKLRTLIPRRR